MNKNELRQEIRRIIDLSKDSKVNWVLGPTGNSFKCSSNSIDCELVHKFGFLELHFSRRS